MGLEWSQCCRVIVIHQTDDGVMEVLWMSSFYSSAKAKVQYITNMFLHGVELPFTCQLIASRLSSLRKCM